MRHRGALVLVFGALSAAAWLALCATPAGAQLAGVRGLVTDSAGAPIPAADVSIVSLHQLTRTDDQGRFEFNKLPRGNVDISVRRLGYQPQTFKAVVTDVVTYSFTVILVAQPAVLAGMAVDGSEQRLRLGIEDFYRRRARGVGTFFTREEIASSGSHVTSDVFRNTPGIRLVRVNGGMGIRLTSSMLRKNCVPLIWIDGQHARGLEVDDIPVNDVEAMELYHGPATTPPQFYDGSVTECGTLVIWSRMPPR